MPRRPRVLNTGGSVCLEFVRTWITLPREGAAEALRGWVGVFMQGRMVVAREAIGGTIRDREADMGVVEEVSIALDCEGGILQSGRGGRITPDGPTS